MVETTQLTEPDKMGHELQNGTSALDVDRLLFAKELQQDQCERVSNVMIQKMRHPHRKNDLST